MRTSGVIFILASITPAAWLLWQTGGWMRESQRATVYGVSIDGWAWQAWGLTYQGAWGAMLMRTELVVVCGALAATFTARRGLRSFGHIVLLGWCALLSVNA